MNKQGTGSAKKIEQKKKYFKSTMLVCATGSGSRAGCCHGEILYNDFDGQMREELSKEALYLAYGVDQQGVDYLKKYKGPKMQELPTLIRMERFFMIIRQMPLRWKTTVTGKSSKKQRNMV